MGAKVERAKKLKPALIDWVYEAEGELAVALERFVAERGRKDRYDIKLQNLLVDTFLSEGEVGDKTPLELYLSEGTVSTEDRNLIESWQRSFTGLFEVIQILPEGFELMNWLTAKHYQVFTNNEVLSETEKARLKPGEILLTRLVPIDDDTWMLAGACVLKGKLGKPKLAVAIGKFKQNYPSQLYGDAPQLLEQAWDSVAQYHQEFTEFFGSDRVTLSGYELNKQMAQLQEQMSQKRLAAAGLDSSKSFQELAQEAGVSEEDIQTAAVDSGAKAEEVSEALQKLSKPSMVTPKIDLPDEIKKAEQVAAFSHPRWGQIFLPSYTKFTTLLESENPQEQPQAAPLVNKYLQDKSINFYIWQLLQTQYPERLETVLQTVLEKPDFDLNRDLEPLLRQYNKTAEPILPEIASVPSHLHNLFEEAVAEVQTKSKSKKKTKKTKGFQ